MRNARKVGAATAAGLLLAGITGGLVVGLSMTNGGADQPSPTVTTTVDRLPSIYSDTTTPAVPQPAVPAAVETPASIVVAVTPTQEQPAVPAPAPAETTEVYVPPVPAPANPEPQVTQGEGIVPGPATSFDAPRAGEGAPMPENTEQPNGGQD